jgi:hypothetical protein
VANGSFAFAAIDLGYGYILPYNSHNIYFAMAIDIDKLDYFVNHGRPLNHGKHRCIPKPEEREQDLFLQRNLVISDVTGCLPHDGYHNPIDQEDYDHSIKQIVDKDYALRSKQRWKELSMTLFHDIGYRRWYDMCWDSVINDHGTDKVAIKNLHPLFRFVIGNILSVIGGIHAKAHADEMLTDIIAQKVIELTPTEYAFLRDVPFTVLSYAVGGEILKLPLAKEKHARDDYIPKYKEEFWVPVGVTTPEQAFVYTKALKKK